MLPDSGLISMAGLSYHLDFTEVMTLNKVVAEIKVLTCVLSHYFSKVDRHDTGPTSLNDE